MDVNNQKKFYNIIKHILGYLSKMDLELMRRVREAGFLVAHCGMTLFSCVGLFFLCPIFVLLFLPIERVC